MAFPNHSTAKIPHKMCIKSHIKSHFVDGYAMVKRFLCRKKLGTPFHRMSLSSVSLLNGYSGYGMPWVRPPPWHGPISGCSHLRLRSDHLICVAAMDPVRWNCGSLENWYPLSGRSIRGLFQSSRDILGV